MLWYELKALRHVLVQNVKFFSQFPYTDIPISYKEFSKTLTSISTSSPGLFQKAKVILFFRLPSKENLGRWLPQFSPKLHIEIK